MIGSAIDFSPGFWLAGPKYSAGGGFDEGLLIAFPNRLLALKALLAAAERSSLSGGNLRPRLRFHSPFQGTRVSSSATIDVPALIAHLHGAVHGGRLTGSAADNIRLWLTDPRYAEYAAEVAAHITAEKWQILDDVFWTVIPFGTGGRRGKMYPIGSNAINDRTIGESAQGMANYVRDQRQPGEELCCAIAYDTRHQSRHFAELCAEIMAGNGFEVSFLDGFRSSPELSFAVRERQCSCGLMISASHNPPSDNAIKAYWSTGGQLLPPHDRGVIERVMSTLTINRLPFAQAVASGRIVCCQDAIDAGYQRSVLAQSLGGPRDVKILYSPMHGVGTSSVCPVLAAAGFTDVEVFGPHAEPDGDFRNIPGRVANPENPQTFDVLIEWARQSGADLILSTDPDADRLGCAAPLSNGGLWRTLTGNQIGALLCEHLLEGRKAAGRLTPKTYIVKTLVTSEMIRRIATSYGVTTYGDLQVGFKYIGGLIDEVGPEHFLLGVEESHGYLTGTYARDKDAAGAALLMAELAAQVKAAGQTLHEKLDALFWQHGCHVEATYSKTMPGSEGMGRMRKLMSALRGEPPTKLAGLAVTRMRDYLNGLVLVPGASPIPFAGPPGDMVILDLEAEGNFVAVRPSGTEPKVKFYMFGYEPPEMLADLESSKSELAARLKQVGQELFGFADSV
jgi:phosphoglucomutase